MLMAYFYIVAKDKEDYDLIKIDDGNSLEDIDLYTSKFGSKNRFIEHLNSNGLNVSYDTDLFIVSKIKKDLAYRELFYSDSDIEDFAKASKNQSINNLKLLGKFFNIVSRSDKFSSLYDNELFYTYPSFRNMMDNSLKKEFLSIEKKDIWMKKNYLIGRDAIYGLSFYSKIKELLNKDKLNELIEFKNDLKEDRDSLAQALMSKINDGFDQILMVDEPRNSISLTYINKDIIANNSFELKEESKIGTIKEDIVDVVEENSNSDINSIYKFLIDSKNMPIGSIKEVVKNKKNTYEINFDVLENNFNVTYSDAERKEFNKLLGVDIKRNLFFAHVNRKNDFSPEAKKEAKHYEYNIYKALDKYSSKQPNMYNKAYDFCMMQSKKVYEAETKRDGHGTK